MENQDIHYFKKIILKRLKERPSDSGRFSKFMLENYKAWKAMSKEMWFELYEEIRAKVPHGLYDFTYFSNSVIGINMYNEFFLKSKFTEKQFVNLKNTISPNGHNHLERELHITYERIEQIISIRKSLKKKGIVLKEVEYVKHVNAQEEYYIMESRNFNDQFEFTKWKNKIEDEIKNQN